MPSESMPRVTLKVLGFNMIDRAVLARDYRDVVRMLPENQRSQHYAYRYETEVKLEVWCSGSRTFGARQDGNVAVMS